MGIVKKLAIKFVRTKFKILSSVYKKKAAEKAFQLFCTPQSRNEKALPPVFEKAEKLHFSFGGNTIKGYRWNHPSEKKVLILHGFESSVINFDRYIKPLIKKGYEVLAFDAPAHGRSSGKTITVLMYKNFIHHIYNNYGPVQSFMAHSFGGLAVSLFLEETEHDETYKLVLIAPATETKTAADNFFKFLKLDEEVRNEFDNLIAEISGHKPEWFSVARAAGHIKAQVLFLQDTQDEMTPISDVKPIMDKNYPNFHFIISEGLGHRRIYKDSDSIKTIIDFL
ncbi:MAG: alpha/beta hydrolase [Flavisolibacter sp.]|jgi:pimeloyl-ACP methyl ester carboxylesterase